MYSFQRLFFFNTSPQGSSFADATFQTIMVLRLGCRRRPQPSRRRQPQYQFKPRERCCFSSSFPWTIFFSMFPEWYLRAGQTGYALLLRSQTNQFWRCHCYQRLHSEDSAFSFFRWSRRLVCSVWRIPNPLLNRDPPVFMIILFFVVRILLFLFDVVFVN